MLLFPDIRVYWEILENEIQTARRVAILGAEKVKELGVFGPDDPVLEIDPSINSEGLFDDVIGIYNAFRNPLIFTPEDLLSSANTESNYKQLALADQEDYQSMMDIERISILAVTIGLLAVNFHNPVILFLPMILTGQ